jgi:FMN phosphatase YigB (HAD superfamily)
MNTKTILVDAVDTSIIETESGQFIKFQELFDLLETYPNKKIILTNANDEQIKEFGLDNVPYPVFTMKHNPNKPDPIYFKTFLEQYKLQASDVVYFEHNPEAVESAKSVGINTYHYNKDLKGLVALKAFLDQAVK